jgi:hypothetical protein
MLMKTSGLGVRRLALERASKGKLANGTGGRFCVMRTPTAESRQTAG